MKWYGELERLHEKEKEINENIQEEFEENFKYYASKDAHDAALKLNR